MKYIIYARKSTESEERQVFFIEFQICENLPSKKLVMPEADPPLAENRPFHSDSRRGARSGGDSAVPEPSQFRSSYFKIYRRIIYSNKRLFW